MKDAQFILGLMYSSGDGVLQNYDEAIKWYTKAAVQGVPEAQFSLGVMYSEGQGVIEDNKTAAKWYSKAALHGIPKAQFNLGIMYCTGEGVPQDYKIAANWFTKVAAQGNAKAQFFLGIMYSEGAGVVKDYTESCKWLLLAEANGETEAKACMKTIGRKMTPTQITTAQSKANKLKEIKGFIAKNTHPAIIETNPESNDNVTKTAISSATGYIITSDGFIATAAHAVEETSKIEILHGKKRYTAKIIRKDISTDVAILKIEDSNLPFLPIVSSSDVKLGDAVFTVGYPRITLQGSDPKFTEGSISSLSGLDNDPKCFQISVPVQPGNSGGPLVNENGEVVGLVIAKLNDIATLLRTGSIPQNVNYALKSSYILSFVESITELSQKIRTPDIVSDRSAAIEKTENSVVLIISYE